MPKKKKKKRKEENTCKHHAMYACMNGLVVDEKMRRDIKTKKKRKKCFNNTMIARQNVGRRGIPVSCKKIEVQDMLLLRRDLREFFHEFLNLRYQFRYPERFGHNVVLVNSQYTFETLIEKSKHTMPALMAVSICSVLAFAVTAMTGT